MSTLKGKTIVVTGGLQGIGGAVIKRLMEDGDTKVVFLAKKESISAVENIFRISSI